MSKQTTLKRTLKLLLVLGLLALTASIALAQDSPSANRADRATAKPLPATVSGAKLDAPIQLENVDAPALRLSPALRGLTGAQRVIVRLTQPPAAAAEATAQGLARQAALAQQSGIVASARSLDANARVLGSTQIVLNAVMLEVEGSVLAELAQNPNVISINPVHDYEVDLSETVPYIGATEVQSMGYDGAGVRVAVLDSGIDYTHIAFDGSGSVEEYLANDPTIIEPGTFPTARVVGGYDFVGSEWPNAAEAPDPDPLDEGPGGGHGTHVADIIGGKLGVAPAVDLYAVKVCSSVSTSCSGIALIQGMEFAVDPNGDGNPNDAVDIINMSLGSSYGDPRWDDLAAAVNNASSLGVLTVASAGNSADKPYAAGTPSTATSALSVAQTQMPSAVAPVMEILQPASVAGLYEASFQPWSAPLTERIEAPVMYGDGAGGNLLGCDPFAPGSLTGHIVLVNRGTCAISIKVSNIAAGGGVAGVVGLIAAGDPTVFSYGGGDPSVPGFNVSLATANAVRAGLAEGEVIAAFDPINGIPLIQHMAGSSSRGPSVGLNEAKPDIGAPGASVSAVFGTGTGTEGFSGTSGAAPMVAGSAALLMDAYPSRSWAEIKAVLMNTGETNIMNRPEFFGGYAAAISRIGGGEVRVNNALKSPVAAWDRNSLTGSLSFGFQDVTGQTDLIRRVTIQNYSNRAITLRSEVEYRYDEDAGGEVRLSVPSWFQVPARGSVTVPVRMFIRPLSNRPLHEWVLNSGSQGGNPDALTFNEYDGYLHFIGVGANAQDVNIHMAWHVLPRGAGNIATGFVRQTNTGWVRNTGMSAAYIDTFSLLGASPEIAGDPVWGGNQAPADLRFVGVQTHPVPAGYCSEAESFVLALAANTWDRYSHASNIWIEFDLDTDGDGNADYAVFNFDASGAFSSVPSDGRSLSWVYDLNAGSADAWFYTDHNTNSGNFVLLLCAEQIGMTAADMLETSMDVSAWAVDWYYGGPADSIEGMNIVPLGERYYTLFQNSDAGSTTLPPRSARLGFGVLDFGDQLNATETGLLWLYGPGAPANNEARAWVLGN
ncbi:S8 family serine peptidase [Promineifilum sp.]|uniref:S8 family peptidase n=1 Tax=Promineifilum sp. TaxID=2664178 RepID=UPI0035B37DD0